MTDEEMEASKVLAEFIRVSGAEVDVLHEAARLLRVGETAAAMKAIDARLDVLFSAPGVSEAMNVLNRTRDAMREAEGKSKH
jgi:hypothetical protein